MSDAQSISVGDPSFAVVDVPELTRFELLLDGQRIGLADYVVDAAGNYVFPHVEIDPAFGGRGYGGVLVRAAMDAMRQRDARVVAVCPFVVSWLDQHREYADLVAHR